MIQRLEQLQALHNAFFQNDDSNLKTMMTGVAMSTFGMLLVIGLYWL